MTVTTLGTSHGDHTYCRFNSSTLVEVEDQMYLVDSGAPVNGLLVRAGKALSRLRAVFITHMHDDHVGGLPGLIKSLIKYPKPGQVTDIFLPEAAAIAPLVGWLRAQHLEIPDGLVRLHALPDVPRGEVFRDRAVCMERIATRHLTGDNGASTAYLFTAEGRRVLFTGDLTHDFTDFPLRAEDPAVDLCLCEATHYPPEAAVPVLAAAPIGRLVFNHVHNPWHGDGEQKLAGYYSGLPYPVCIAHDGDVFTV